MDDEYERASDYYKRGNALWWAARAREGGTADITVRDLDEKIRARHKLYPLRGSKVVWVTVETALAFRKMVSYWHRKVNRKRAMDRRKRIGRGRW